MAYISGDRYQLNFFPQSIDEMVSADDPVRAYDAIIDKIFEEVEPRRWEQISCGCIDIEYMERRTL